MTEKFELFKCKICGNIVEVVHSGQGKLSCCNEEMTILQPQSTDGVLEKHVPVVDCECESSGVKIRVGSEPHPMTEEHHIEFVEIISPTGRSIHREYLSPGELPEVLINCRSNLGSKDGLKAREYCNIHGLYTNREGDTNGQ